MKKVRAVQKLRKKRPQPIFAKNFKNLTQILAQKAKILENDAVSGKITALIVEARYAFHRVEHSNPGCGALERAEKAVKVQKKCDLAVTGQHHQHEIFKISQYSRSPQKVTFVLPPGESNLKQAQA